jgi:multidrug efflux pump subunit AcrB
MNIRLGKISSVVTGIAVLSFSLSMLVGTIFTSCLSSIFIAIGFVPFMCSVFAVNKRADNKAIGYTGVSFAAVYAVIILLVYYAECTTVRMNTSLSEEALSIISYGYGGSLFFNYDLLGYGFMALTTFFIAFLVEPSSRADKVFQWMLWIHGIFFISCFIVPMFPVFTAGTSGADDRTGVILLEIWCAYFIPICVLGYKYFSSMDRK